MPKWHVLSAISSTPLCEKWQRTLAWLRRAIVSSEMIWAVKWALLRPTHHLEEGSKGREDAKLIGREAEALRGQLAQVSSRRTAAALKLPRSMMPDETKHSG